MARLKMLNAHQVAQRLSVSTKTVYRLWQNGGLPYVKIGGLKRIDEKDFNAVLLKLKEESSAENGFEYQLIDEK